MSKASENLEIDLMWIRTQQALAKDERDRFQLEYEKIEQSASEDRKHAIRDLYMNADKKLAMLQRLEMYAVRFRFYVNQLIEEHNKEHKHDLNTTED